AGSAEWKDYSQFRTGVNDPPSLVKEHSEYLLNRSTHVLVADREEGFQLEGSLAPPPWGTVTTNWSRADNANARRFEEWFLELRSPPRPGERGEAPAFYDGSREELVGIADRRTAGAAGTLRFTPLYSASLDVETQSARRELGPVSQPFHDDYAS